eukprot:6054863-Amphidinium_carterae.1
MKTKKPMHNNADCSEGTLPTCLNQNSIHSVSRHKARKTHNRGKVARQKNTASVEVELQDMHRFKFCSIRWCGFGIE